MQHIGSHRECRFIFREYTKRGSCVRQYAMQVLTQQRNEWRNSKLNHRIRDFPYFYRPYQWSMINTVCLNIGAHGQQLVLNFWMTLWWNSDYTHTRRKCHLINCQFTNLTQKYCLYLVKSIRAQKRLEHCEIKRITATLNKNKLPELLAWRRDSKTAKTLRTMSTPSVELSSYRDQHFKVSREHFPAAYPTNSNLKNSFRLHFNSIFVFRAHVANRRNCYGIRRRFTSEICRFTLLKSRFMNCFHDAVIFDASSWVWINLKRHRAASASLNTIHVSMPKMLCASLMARDWTIESCVSIGMLALSKDDNMVAASRAAKCATNIEPILILVEAATENWSHRKLHQTQAKADNCLLEKTRPTCKLNLRNPYLYFPLFFCKINEIQDHIID